MSSSVLPTATRAVRPPATRHHGPAGARDVGIRGFAAQVRRVIVQEIRGRHYLLFAIGLPLALYLTYLVTGLGGPLDGSVEGIAWPAWLMVSMAAFAVMNATTVVAAGGPRSASSGDDIARARGIVRIASAILLAVPPLILLAVAGTLGGVRLPSGEWVMLGAALWLGALPFVALGLLLRPVLDAETGNVVLLGVLVLLAILGGLFQPIETLPPALAVVAQVVPSYHLADLGWTSLIGRTLDPVDVVVLTGYLLGLGALVIWRKRSKDGLVGDRGHASAGT